MRPQSIVRDLLISGLFPFLLGGCATFRPSRIYEGPNDIKLTAIHSALPAGAFKASVEPAYSIPTTLKVSQRIAIHLVVTNRSEETWPSGAGSDQKYQISIGDHWLNEKGDVVTMDDGRSVLPYDLEPGASAEILLNINAPNQAGSYMLEVEPVQEDVAWFSQRGSKPLQLRFAVENNR